MVVSLFLEQNNKKIHALEYCYLVVLCCIVSSIVSCFVRLINYLTLSVDYEKYFFGLSVEFIGKTAFSFSLYGIVVNQGTVTSGERLNHSQNDIYWYTCTEMMYMAFNL